MARSPMKVTSENDVTPSASAEEALDFDDDTLRAIAQVYMNDGNDKHKKKDFGNAINFYTEGIQINCKDEEVIAKLYSNRATSHLRLGNYEDSIRDARTATDLRPTFLIAIKTGASACMALKRFGEAITWCDKGVAIDVNNKKLLELKIRSVEEQNKQQKPDGENKEKNLGIHTVKGKVGDLECPNAKKEGDNAGEAPSYGNLGIAFVRNSGNFRKAIDYYELYLKRAKEVGDKAGEGYAYVNLGIAFRNLGDFRKAINYYELNLKIAKEVGDKAGEGYAYGNLGNAFLNLGDFKKAIDYYELNLKIVKEVGHKVGEGSAYGNLGNALLFLGDFKKAIDYHELSLKIAKEIGNKASEGRAYGNLGNAFLNLGDFRKAIHYYQLCLEIAKEVGDKGREGSCYGNLGSAFRSLGDFRKSIDYFQLHLKIAKEVGDKAGEGRAYGNLGNAFAGLGDFRKAIDNYKWDLKIAKEVGDKAGEGSAYGNLGSAFISLGDCSKAIDYYKLELKIAKEVGDKAGEGRAYGNLGNGFLRLDDFRTAIDYFELCLKISKEVGDKAGEGITYGSLGITFLSLDDFRKAVDYFELCLKISKEVGDKNGEAIAYHHLGLGFESLGFLPRALECYEVSVELFNHLRNLLQSKDEWKISYRDKCDEAYTGLLRVLLKKGKIVDALFAAEKGRAQALTDLMLFQFGIRESQSVSQKEEEECLKMKCHIPSSTVFQAFDGAKIYLWVLSKEGPVRLRQKEIGEACSLLKDAAPFFQSLIQSAFRQIHFRSEVRCENRSLDALNENRHKADEKSDAENYQRFLLQGNSLSTLYNILIQPIADLIQGDELIIVPDGPLWLAPYAALMDANSKYLCDSFRIRLIPSLISLKLIADCPEEYHSRDGALLVGDPWVEEVTDSKGEKVLEPLPFARTEVEMIGKILNITPIIGKKATKREVLERLHSVALVHIAAHGCMETGEIAPTPNPKRTSAIPTKEDYVLSMADVLSVKLRARLVVLSCCHSGQGEIKAEGVVGIARAFMGAGARSVLVSLWAIDDEATLEFMRSFYQHLAEGRSAGESLNQAMKCLRESDKYSDVKYWAPFVLIGDDVTLAFDDNN